MTTIAGVSMVVMMMMTTSLSKLISSSRPSMTSDLSILRLASPCWRSTLEADHGSDLHDHYDEEDHCQGD